MAEITNARQEETGTRTQDLSTDLHDEAVGFPRRDDRGTTLKACPGGAGPSPASSSRGHSQEETSTDCPSPPSPPRSLWSKKPSSPLHHARTMTPGSLHLLCSTDTDLSLKKLPRWNHPPSHHRAQASIKTGGFGIRDLFSTLQQPSWPRAAAHAPFATAFGPSTKTPTTLT